MSLPGARGPLSQTMLSVPTGDGPQRWEPAAADPYGEDLQLALYLCYELHYRGLPGVPDDLEWDPNVLRLRADLVEARRRLEP